MTFHESLWLATAAAAPVIALAATVALPDAARLYRDDVAPLLDYWFESPAMLRSAMQAAGGDVAWVEATTSMDLAGLRAKWSNGFKPLRRLASIAWGAGFSVLVLQAVLLAVSLAALAYRVDVIPRWLAIVLPVSGIILLTYSLSLVSAYRTAARSLPRSWARRMVESFTDGLKEDARQAAGQAPDQADA